MTGVTADCDVRHLASKPAASELVCDERKKEGAMVHQDFLFLMLMVIALYFASWEAGHWKH